MVTCQCCPYGFHIYLDFVQYCEKLGKNAPSKDQHIRRNNRRHRKSKILMLGFDELSEIPNLPYSNSVVNRNSFTDAILNLRLSVLLSGIVKFIVFRAMLST